MIKTNRAALVETAADIKYLMGWDEVAKSESPQIEMLFNLTPEEKEIVQLLKQHGKLHIDQISDMVQTDPGSLSATLLNLEFRGVIRNLPGRIFSCK